MKVSENMTLRAFTDLMTEFEQANDGLSFTYDGTIEFLFPNIVCFDELTEKEKRSADEVASRNDLVIDWKTDIEDVIEE